MKQEEVWRGIDLLADELGVTPARLAKMAGLDQAVFSAGRRKRPNGGLRWPSMESLAKVLQVADISLGDFVNYMYGNPETKAGFRLPVQALSAAGNNDHYDLDGLPTGVTWDRVAFPDVQDPNCFGLIVDCDDYEPIYRKGDMLVCAPGVSIRRGDRIVYCCVDSGLAIGMLMRQSPFTTDIALPDARNSITIPAQEISWMTRITWARQ